MKESDKLFYSHKVKNFPIKFFILYFFITFLIFLLSDAAYEISNLYSLSLYVISFYGFLFLGYWLGVRSRKPYFKDRYSFNLQKKLIILGGIYFIAWGVNFILDFGATDFSQVLRTLINPGEAYKNKFDVFENKELSGQINRVTQILLILSFFSSVFVILLVLNWKKISFSLKIFSIFSIIIYVVGYLFIGTQKGIGDVVIYLLVGFFLVISNGFTVTKRKKVILYSLASILIISMFSYMVAAQGSRAILFGQNSSVLFNNIHDSFLARNFGEQIAFGFYNTIGYPSHGYLGLSYNLSQNFEFSYGAGLSPAFESYRLQYFGGEQNILKTYPFRTEAATGWPAGMYWATAFPSLASDFTFLGTIVFMFIIGFIFARTWIRAIVTKDILAYALLGQLFIFMFYLPANNQVLMQRQGFLIIISIIVLAIFRELTKKKYYV